MIDAPSDFEVDLPRIEKAVREILPVPAGKRSVPTGEIEFVE